MNNEALKLALEALENPWKAGPDGVAEAITAIEFALAQPEQEPVATLDDLEQEIYENTRQFVSRDVMEWMLKRYYTTPPQEQRSCNMRTWVGLTIEDIVALFPNEFLHSTYDTEKLISDVRIVEAKLKEKNT